MIHSDGLSFYKGLQSLHILLPLVRCKPPHTQIGRHCVINLKAGARGTGTVEYKWKESMALGQVCVPCYVRPVAAVATWKFQEFGKRMREDLKFESLV